MTCDGVQGLFASPAAPRALAVDGSAGGPAQLGLHCRLGSLRCPSAFRSGWITYNREWDGEGEAVATRHAQNAGAASDSSSAVCSDGQVADWQEECVC